MTLYLSRERFLIVAGWAGGGKGVRKENKSRAKARSASEQGAMGEGGQRCGRNETHQTGVTRHRGHLHCARSLYCQKDAASLLAVLLYFALLPVVTFLIRTRVENNGANTI